jgi:putative iron-dependent peroxidase
LSTAQPAILEPVPPLARYLSFSLVEPAAAAAALDRLRARADLADGRRLVVGLGASLAAALGRELPGLRCFASAVGPGLEIPSTPAALWGWLRGDDRGTLLHATRRLQAMLAPALRLEGCIDAFRHGRGLDLSGYEDGTENPTGAEAEHAALLAGAGPGLDGSSFVAVQPWRHDFARFDAMAPAAQDAAIGRRRADNGEIDDAPPSAHVKRTAQESFDPEAFVLRRSMPWADGHDCGLVFVAFGRSFDAFEAQLRRMIGAEDGIVDALFGFTRPVGGAYYWCPPLQGGRLDLRALGL